MDIKIHLKYFKSNSSIFNPKYNNYILFDDGQFIIYYDTIDKIFYNYHKEIIDLTNTKEEELFQLSTVYSYPVPLDVIKKCQEFLLNTKENKKTYELVLCNNKLQKVSKCKQILNQILKTIYPSYTKY